MNEAEEITENVSGDEFCRFLGRASTIYIMLEGKLLQEIFTNRGGINWVNCLGRLEASLSCQGLMLYGVGGEFCGSEIYAKIGRRNEVEPWIAQPYICIV